MTKSSFFTPETNLPSISVAMTLSLISSVKTFSVSSAGSGVGYLQTTLAKRFYPEFWQARTQLEIE
jgi:hypothetical protein